MSLDSSKPYVPTFPADKPNRSTRPQPPVRTTNPNGSTALTFGIIMVMVSCVCITYQISNHEFFRGNVAGLLPFVVIALIGIGVSVMYYICKKPSTHPATTLTLGLFAGAAIVVCVYIASGHHSKGSFATPLLGLVSIFVIIAGSWLIRYGVRLIANHR